MRLDFLRHASWLDAKRARGYAWLLAVLNLATIAWLVATSHNGVDRNGFLLGTDFLSFWTSGRMLRAGADVYDVAAHIAAQRTWFAEPGYTAFFYPPTFLPYCYPLGFLPYFPALIAWIAVTGAGFVAAVRAWFRQTGALPLHWTHIAAFPPATIAITHGQTSFLAAALLGLGLLLTPRRPVAAGMLLGLAVFKPQLALLVPLALLLTGQWRTIAAATASATILALVATLAFGPGIWRGWIAGMGPAQAAMESGAIGYAKMQSLFAAAMLLGAPVKVAYWLQTGLGLAAAALVARASWRRQFGPALAAATLTGGLLATPFLLDYDLVLLAFPLIFMAGRGFAAWEKIVASALFIAPAFARPLAMYAGIPIVPPLLVALFLLAIRLVWREPAGPTPLNPRTAPAPG